MKTRTKNQRSEIRNQKSVVITKFILLLALLLTLGAARAQAQDQMIGINILLNQPVTDSNLQDLGTHGEVLDVISQINGVTLRAHTSELSTIQTLPYVAGANPDAQDYPQSDFSAGTNASWTMMVTEFTSASSTADCRLTGELISPRRGSRWSLLEVLAAGAENEERFRASRRHGNGTLSATESR
jgi:hypothetical protein